MAETINNITKTKFFKIDHAVQCDVDSKTVFIVANETKNQNGKIGRFYTVFPSFKEFLSHRQNYPHCHEILVNHKNNFPTLKGRLVFDFDITHQVIPPTFKKQIESVIYDVIERYFIDLNIDILDYVWSTSQNPNKFSKHLTVKNLYFDNWLEMSKIFYKLFCIVWDETYMWIDSNKLIDAQIVRNRASLRMVGSSKINGYPLVFDSDEHKLTDSLIRIYFKKQRDIEQLVTKENIKPTVFQNVISVDDDWDYLFDNSHNTNQISSSGSNSKNIKQVYPSEIYEVAFKMVNDLCPGIFKRGKINGQYLVLLRRKPNRCLISGKLHEAENAFLVIDTNEDFYTIKFGCYRFCSSKKYLGCVSQNALIPIYHPDFEHLVKKPTEFKMIISKKKGKTAKGDILVI